MTSHRGMGSAADASRSTNEAILKRLNRHILSKTSSLVSRKQQGDRFRSRLRAVEGEVAEGLDVYTPEFPPDLIDFAGLTAPWSYFAHAIHIEQVNYRTFESQVEEEFHLILDLSRSMRYPLRRLYAGEELGDLSFSECMRGKPSLLKWVAAMFTRAAVIAGFSIRISTLSADGVREGERLRPHHGLPRLVMEQIDRHFIECTAHPRRESSSLYATAAQSFSRRGGVTVFCGDWLDAVWEWKSQAGRDSWRRTLELFRHWGQARSLIVARINDSEEVAPPPTTTTGRTIWSRMRGDCRHRRVEDLDAEDGLEAEDERIGDAMTRLRDQRDWAARLEPTLRACCRSYLTLTNAPQADDRAWGNHFVRIWEDLMGSRR